MMELLIPLSFIATAFFFLWVIKYPKAIKEALLFQHIINGRDIFMCCLTWLFLLLTGLCATFIYGVLSVPTL